jgi:pyruvate dehydrogenase E2 component (dihydrolipoamide acetyltransferase)
MTDTPGRRLVMPTPMRQAIARRMTASKAEAPHFYVSTDVDMTAATAALEALNAGRPAESRISQTAVLVVALARALAEEPAFNARWVEAGLEEWTAINISVAVAVDGGLIAPALLDCAGRDLESVAEALRDLAARARSGGLRSRELTDGTFTLSNLGMFDVGAFTAIVNPPQVAILATGRTAPRPAVVDGSVVARPIMTATLSADHRAVDGAGAASFVGRVKRLLEDDPAPESVA